MKRLLVFIGVVLGFMNANAGGILTNGNQSAQYIRMLSRNASTDLDAVYFNPAGLIKLDNGFYVSFQSQSLFQSKTVVSNFPILNQSKFEGTLTAPIFPTAFLVYKKDWYALSLGFGPNSGGGSAEFDNGLPSFEKKIASAVPALAGLSKIGQRITGYGSDVYFNGKSAFYGFQGGMTVKVNEKFSVYGGFRYLPSFNKYDGYLKNIQLNVNGQMKGGAAYLRNEVAPIFTSLATQASSAATSVKPLVDGGASLYTLAQVQGAGFISAAQRASLEAGLAGLGLTSAQIGQLNMQQIQSTFTSGAANLTAQAGAMTAAAASFDDKNVDVRQTGTGFTPIFGVNISPNKDLNIGVKYEFKTRLNLVNDTKVDGTGLFPDKQETRSDLPALFSVGVDYRFSSKLNISGSFNSYHDKGVNWGTNIYGQKRTIDHNTWEVAFGAQYQVLPKLAISAGYLHTEMGNSTQFQSDFSYYNPGETFGTGFQLKPTARLTIDAGIIFTMYQNSQKNFTDPVFGSYMETYKKQNLGVALGLAYHFGGSKL